MRYRTLASLAAVAGAAFVFALYWVARITNARMFANINNCPSCDSTDVNPSGTPALSDVIFRRFRCVPYRCHVCSNRYYRGVNRTRISQSIPARAVVTTPDSSSVR
jgi:uncharacterized protein with PIN domain